MGAQPVVVPMPELIHDLSKMRDAVTEKTKIVFLPSPNNPTGTANSSSEIINFVNSLPDHVIFCLDEAYAEYLLNQLTFAHLLAQEKKFWRCELFPRSMVLLVYALVRLRKC